MPRLPCPDPRLRVESIVKRFKRGPVVGPISFVAKAGEVFALIGPNGAGKTTTLRMILGIYRPDEGRVLLCGRDVTGVRSHGYVAYVPEETAIYPRLTGWEHLLFYARLYLGDPVEARRLAERAAEISGLGKDLSRRVGDYSKGMKRKLLLAFAVALDTPLLVLDEPTSGLDVYSSVRIRRLIRGAADSGRIVLMTSHNMLEVSQLADRVAFIARGRIVDLGTPDELLERYKASDLEEAFVKAIGAEV